MNVYVVCMDSYYVRDAQMFDPEGLSEKELNETDIFSETMEMHWHDIEVTPFMRGTNISTVLPPHWRKSNHLTTPAIAPARKHTRK